MIFFSQYIPIHVYHIEACLFLRLPNCLGFPCRVSGLGFTRQSFCWYWWESSSSAWPGWPLHYLMATSTVKKHCLVSTILEPQAINAINMMVSCFFYICGSGFIFCWQCVYLFVDIWSYYLPYLYSCISFLGVIILMCEFQASNPHFIYSSLPSFSEMRKSKIHRKYIYFSNQSFRKSWDFPKFGFKKYFP